MHVIILQSLNRWLKLKSHSFMRRSHPLSDQLPGEHTGHLAAISWFPSWCNEPIWNAHIPPITIIHQVLILLTHRGMEG